MSKATRVLVGSHIHAIGNRSKAARQQMYPVWGMVWILRGRPFLRIGTATLMTMSYHPSRIDLCAINPQVKNGEIHYSDIRMSHNFAKRPVPGGSGQVLDPREASDPSVGPGQHPNANWVRHALALDYRCQEASRANWRLPVVPTLPKVWAGYRSKAAVTPELTETLRKSWEVLYPGASEEDLQNILAQSWDSLWVTPDAPGNVSGLWLLPFEYTTNLNTATSIYEDFTTMLGVRCRNPIRELHQVHFVNPTRRCAKALGIDVAQMWQVIDRSDAEQPTPEYEASLACFKQLSEAVQRELWNHNKVFSDDEILHALRCPSDPVILPFTKGSLIDLSVEHTMQQMRKVIQHRRPELADGVTDDDLHNAIENPAAPLVASRACESQVLLRDSRLSPEETLQFGPQILRRERTYLYAWSGRAELSVPRGTETGVRKDDRGVAGEVRQSPETVAQGEGI